MLPPPCLVVHCHVQEISRLGFWQLSEMQTCYLLTGLKASILLAMGGWDKDEPHSFWAERFLCPVPGSLVTLLMPWYTQLQATVAQADEKGTHVHFSARGILRLLPLLAYVAVQDALELCADGRPAEYRDNPVHSLLLTNSLFRWVFNRERSPFVCGCACACTKFALVPPFAVLAGNSAFCCFGGKLQCVLQLDKTN